MQVSINFAQQSQRGCEKGNLALASNGYIFQVSKKASTWPFRVVNLNDFHYDIIASIRGMRVHSYKKNPPALRKEYVVKLAVVTSDHTLDRPTFFIYT